MKTVQIIGVPEHFNLPWHLAIEDGLFEDAGIELIWTDIPEGTGRMRDMLRSGEADMAIILTGGIIKDIINGNPSSIVQTYVESPLLWGIHVAAHAPYQSVAALQGTRAAISRYGSGSHLVSYLNARNHHWNTDKLQFVTVNDLPGAVKALSNNEADYFMWEHFTTKPWVDNGTFRRLGDIPTPWPCFVIAARNEFIENHRPVLKRILEIINTVLADFKNIPSIDRTLANRYEQKLEDIREWLALTHWSRELIDAHTIEAIQKELIAVGIISETRSYEALVTRV